MLLHTVMVASSLCCAACAFRCGLRGNRTVQITALVMLASMVGMAVAGTALAMLWALLLLAGALALGPGIRRASDHVDMAVATHRSLSFVATAGLFLAHAAHHSGSPGTNPAAHHHGSGSGVLTASVPSVVLAGTALIVLLGAALLVALARSGRLRSLATLDVAAMSAMLASMTASAV